MALTRGFIRNAVTTPLDARLADMGIITGNADGTPRAGVLGSAPSIVSAAATMDVSVATAAFVTSKGKADGVAIFANDGAVNVPISPAPASNSRIDVVYVKHNDDTTGDANALPIFGVATGIAAASPVKPSLETGALELATVRIYAGTTSTSGGSNTVTNTYQMTAPRGGVVPFRTKTDLAAWTTAEKGQLAYVLAAGATLPYQWNGTSWNIGDGLPYGVNWRTVSQSITEGGSRQLTYDGEARVRGGMAFSGNAFTVPTSGIYEIAVVVNYDVSSTGRRDAAFAINGTIQEPYRYIGVAAGSVPFLATTRVEVPLNAGDVITAWAQQTSGATRAVTGMFSVKMRAE